MMPVEVGENIVAEMLGSADFRNDEKLFSHPRLYRDAIAPPGRIRAIVRTL